MTSEILQSVYGLNCVHKQAALASTASQIVKIIDQEFGNEKAAKNAAYDELIQILQKQKEV